MRCPARDMRVMTGLEDGDARHHVLPLASSVPSWPPPPPSPPARPSVRCAPRQGFRSHSVAFVCVCVCVAQLYAAPPVYRSPRGRTKTPPPSCRLPMCTSMRAETMRC